MTVRVGILGTGFAAQTHADALRRVPGVVLAGIASRRSDRAAEAARRFGVAHAYQDPSELISDPEIDAVHVCSTNHMHAQQASAALLAGKHVICEKPLAFDSHGANDLLTVAETAEESGTLSAVCFNYRYYPMVQQLRRLLASGEYGRVHYVHGGYLQDWLLYDTDWNWRVDPAENGASRAMADIGSHWVDLVQHVSGERVVEVLADLGTVHPVRHRPLHEASTFEHVEEGELESVKVDSEDFGSVLLRFEGGARGMFGVSQVSAGHRNHLTFEIDAAEAAMAWDQEHPDTAWIGRRREPSMAFPRDAALGVPLTRTPAGHPEGWRETFYNLFAEFYAAVMAGRPATAGEAALASFAEGRRTGLVIDAILRSHRSGAWETL